MNKNTKKKLPIFVGFALLTLSSSAFALDFNCEDLKDSKVIGQDSKSTYLGEISRASYYESIFNKSGDYGSMFSQHSVFSMGEFGNMFSSFSATNPSSKTPPLIVKNGKKIGYLSSNKALRGSVAISMVEKFCLDSF